MYSTTFIFTYFRYCTSCTLLIPLALYFYICSDNIIESKLIKLAFLIFIDYLIFHIMYADWSQRGLEPIPVTKGFCGFSAVQSKYVCILVFYCIYLALNLYCFYMHSVTKDLLVHHYCSYALLLTRRHNKDQRETQ